MTGLKKADLFISIHADAINRKDVRGASIYTLSEKASDAETAQLAEQENKVDLIGGIDLASHEEEVADILLDLTVRETMNESHIFAEHVVRSFRADHIRLLKTAHRQAGFAVLKSPDVPSILIELGFLSNRSEVKLLQTKSFQEKASTAILRGVDHYFRERKRINNL